MLRSHTSVSNPLDHQEREVDSVNKWFPNP